jgi:hypothetical protein
VGLGGASPAEVFRALSSEDSELITPLDRLAEAGRDRIGVAWIDGHGDALGELAVREPAGATTAAPLGSPRALGSPKPS